MLYIIGTQKEAEKIRNLPSEVTAKVLGIVKLLDYIYGENRDVLEADGGYVCVVENDEDVEELKEEYQIDLYRIIPENVDIVSADWINVFFLCNNEFGINIFIPIGTAVIKQFYKYL